jgi:ABC-2 type transport system permease protein
MSVRGVLAVAGAECVKLRAQLTARIVLVLCAAAPWAFAAVMRLQATVPEDTLFGRSVKESGFATPLVVLGFGALWVFPVLASIVGGDLFSAEDRYGTWASVLTRSRGRAEIFTGKVMIALSFSTLAIVALGASSVAAGMLVIGIQPLIDLSGAVLPPGQALVRVALAWASVLPPTLGLAAVAVLLSVASRSSVTGIAVPVVAGLLMQLCAYVDGPEAIRRLLIVTALGAWHGLLTEHPYYRPLVGGMAVSALYVIMCLAAAYRLFRRRDIGG